ncbi:hypothetical protein GCM10011575_29570 [Microlunatus endophyticus]|uniref:Neutral zinc metallopeptidase n=1 Tax=Microlunatus endophyticus TaxID=1716077 RepID=A0A917SB00_9ACTN|nr:neutral zinc metallopeptidase [Microlunatus endophyticus]GGL69011.1 hypothetical protein GCM10011575_29570 [Microlunatus endophyticus]
MPNPQQPNPQQPSQQQWQQQQRQQLWQRQLWQRQLWQQRRWQQRQTMPYGYGPGGYQGRRRSSWPMILLISGPLVLAVIVVLVIVIAVVGIGASAASQGGSSPQISYPSGQASASQEPVPDPSTRSHPTHSSKPAPKPTTRATTATKKPSAKKTSAKTSKPKQPTRPDLRKQQGYEEIPLPTVSTSPAEAKKLVADDNLYLEKVAKHACSDGPPMDRYPYPSLSNAAMQSWLQKIADCDQAMWAGPVARAGFQATKVRVQIFDSAEIGTPCGTQKRGHFAAFYCSANQELYVDPTLANPKAAPGYDWGQYWQIVSHEYGHSIQARTGILTSASVLESAAGSTASADKWTRRIELQAQCFSGLAVTRVGGMSTARYKQQVQFETTRRLTSTHGSGEHQAAWFAQGHKYADVYQCDTFKAPASDVS